MLAVLLQLPVAGSYSSALLKAPPVTVSSRHQHLAIGQQRRRVIVACGAHAAGAAPAPARRIIQLRAAQEQPLLPTPPATSTLPLGSSVAV